MPRSHGTTIFTPRVTALIVVVAIWGAAVGLFFAGRGTDYRFPTPESAPAAAEPRPLDVTLDPSGRPYDATLARGATVVRRPLATIHAPSRQVLFMGGEETMWVQSGEHTPVTLAERPGRDYGVDAIWIDRKNDPDNIVGVVIVERETRIVRWREEFSGYGTDAGLGAITTVEWADRGKLEDNEVSRAYWKTLVDEGRQWVGVDADLHDGTDTVIFSNGFGDGGFPSVAGYDASGRRAAIALWTAVVPWRLAFPAGKPPTQVTERENELAACLAGKRTIEGWSGCRAQ